jgi:membrane fusion protein (multidrug efflux system)
MVMKKRMILMLAVVAGCLMILAFVKTRQIQAAIAAAGAFQQPPEAVTTIVVRSEEWPHTISAIGSVAAVHGVIVSADLPGIVADIAASSGARVSEGQLLLKLDTRQEEAQLAAAEAQLNLARLNIERARGLHEEGIVSQSDLDNAVAENKSAEAHLGEIQAVIDRKQLRAPFSGILGIRQVNLGQYLKAGDAVIPLQSLDPVFVNFAVPQQEVGHLEVGSEVRVMSEGPAASERTGRITAIDSVVDEATRNVQVQATLRNADGKLRPGMFVKTEVVLGASSEVLALPASAINYAPYGDSIFIVGDMKDAKGQSYRGVRQEFVKLGPNRGDQVAVLSGVRAGEEVVTSGVFKLRNGAAIQVNNSIQPANNPDPKPQDN